MLFVSCDNWKTLFFIYIFCYLEVWFNPPCCYPTDISWSVRLVLQYVFSVTISYLERRLHHNNFSSSKTFSRRLQEILQDVLKALSKINSFYAEYILKTSWRPTKYLLGRNIYLYLKNLNLDLTNLYVANLYLKI